MLSPKEILKFAYKFEPHDFFNFELLPTYKKILYLRKIKLSDNLFIIKIKNNIYRLITPVGFLTRIADLQYLQ